MRKETKMSKKLKIQFWKAEKALAMQILEQEGLPKYKTYGFIRVQVYPCFCGEAAFLRGNDSRFDFVIEAMPFKTNTERDAYLDKVINAITDELFTGKGELKIGEMCEVRDNGINPWFKRKLLAILPKKYDYKFVTDASRDANSVQLWVFARPFTKRTEPTVEECGDVVTYTWEEK